VASYSVERLLLALKRLENILRTHGIATARILENKISDAGPTNQRIDPHILSKARKISENQGLVLHIQDRHGTPWYYLKGTPEEEMKRRFAELREVYDQTLDKHFTLRMGQALEIAVSKALLSQKEFQSVGHFHDLDKHSDDTLFKKEEPPSMIGDRSCEGKLDFVMFTQQAGVIGIEVKNVREWIYSQSDEVIAMLKKCCALDAVPVLITRRYSYEAFSVLTECGVIVHQMYNQRYANADAELATKVRDKRLLGYHDVRVGNDPDERLMRFVHVNLPKLLEGAREKFDARKELLDQYVNTDMAYAEFVAKVRGRFVEQPDYSAGDLEGYGQEDSEVDEDL
jgi:hypothetical protein